MARYILLVEDNADDEALALRALGRCATAVRIEVARDGAEALDRLLSPREGPLPEVVLLDLKLPKLSGLEVLKRMRADPRTRCIPVVVLTSSSEDQDIAESYLAGANSYVRKPVDFDEFTRAVGEIGHFWVARNESPHRAALVR